MPTKSYVLNVPRVWDQTTTRTDSPKLQQQLQALLKGIDSAGESVIAIQAIQSGWGSAFMNEQQFVASSYKSQTYGAGLGFSYTDTLVIITRSS